MSAVGVSARFAGIRTWFDALALRERLLMALTALAVVWALWSFALQQFLDAGRTAATNGINSTQAQIQAAVAEQRVLSGTRGVDPNADLRDRQQALQQSIAALEERLQRAVESFVAPERVPELLAELMRQHQGLRFSAAERLPSEPLMAEQTEANALPSLYRHPIRIEFEGNYFDVLAYLQVLERSDWRLNWRKLDYAVHAYPMARVSIEVDTLSRSREWLGV